MNEPVIKRIATVLVLILAAALSPSSWAATVFPESFSINEGEAVNDDLNVDGATVVLPLGTPPFAEVSGPSNGALFIDVLSGLFQYVPAVGFNGTDSFDWSFTDGGGTSVATVTIDVANIPPTATPQSFAVDEEVLYNGSVAATDAGGDGSFTFNVVSGPNNGTLNFDGATGTFDYTGNPDFNGADSFDFTANDGDDDSTPATVSITVNPVNDAPTADDQAFSVDEDVTYSGTVTGSDVDSAVTFSLVSGPGNGTLDFDDATGAFEYTGNPDFNGGDSFQFVATDGSLSSAPATVTITVDPINDQPTADDQSFTVDEDDTFNGTVTGADIEGAVTFSVVSGPGSGTLNFDDATGAFDYTGNPDFNGSDTFEFVATDGSLDSAPATVTITVSAVNDLPVADAQSHTVDEDDTFNGTVTGSDVESAVTFTVLTPPANGTLNLDSATGSFDYTGSANFNGSDSFEFVANDGTADGAAATVAITVTPVNDQPTVVGTVPTVTTTEDTPTTTSLTGVFGDVDIATNGDLLTLTVESFTGSTIASAVMNGTDLEISYVPDANNDPGSVVVRATDSGGLFEEVTVNVNVAEANDPPVVVGPIPAITGDEDTPVTGSFTGVFDDVDIATNGDSLIFYVVSWTGSVIDTAVMSGETLELTFLPDQNGSATVTVRAEDTSGATVDAVANVTVNPVNDTPVIVPPVPTVTVVEDTGSTSVNLSALFDDVDIVTNGDALTLSVASFSGSAIDSATMVGLDLDIFFLPDENGTGAVTVRATDSSGATVDATIDVEVSAVNDSPVVVGAIPDVDVDEDAGDTVLDFSGVFEDVDVATSGDVLSLSVTDLSGGGFIESITDSGMTLILAYLPDRFGFATLTVRATDLAGAFAEYVVNITVNSVDDPPFVAVPIATVGTFEDAPPFNVNLTTLFDDPDIATSGDNLTLSVVGFSPASLIDSATLTTPDATSAELQVSLAPDESGAATVTVRATDSTGLTETYAIPIDVTSVNDEPIANDDTAVMDEDGAAITIDVLDNDYLAEEPTIVTGAGAGGFSESAPSIIIDPLGDPIGGPNGTVTFTGTTVTYEPKANFHGEDFFTYTITDSNGDSTTGTVTVTVNPVNDRPTTQRQTITHDILEDSVLVVPASDPDTMLDPGYDLDHALLDAAGNPVGGTLSANVVSFPTSAEGSLTFDPVTGAYEFTPAPGFTGVTSFTYELFDGTDTSDTYTVQITVIAAPPPPAPPAPGEVSVFYNLSNVPLEQSASVPANVLVLIDDSGSMDWNLLVAGDGGDGKFELDNDPIANSGVRRRDYAYLYDLSSNAYSSTSSNGRVLPTEEALEANSRTDNNEYGVWRARNHLFNSLYYNPEVQYTPWIGQDNVNVDFADADPSNVRLDPRSSTNTIDILAPVSYESDDVPEWDNNGGTEDIDVNNLYIPFYYSTTATPPLAWDDPHTRIEITDGGGPLAGGLYPGGPQRLDCRVGDDDPSTCTYAQEIQNFANWFQYYRSREYVTKDSVGKVVAGIQDIRIGYESVSGRDREPVRLMNDLYTEGNKKELLDDFYDTRAAGGTPLRDLLDRAGRIFSCDGFSGDNCPALPMPDGACQQNFALLFSDGYWNGGGGVGGNQDDDGAGPFDGGRYADSRTNTLADTAMFYYENDLWPTREDQVPISSRDENGAPAGTFDEATRPFMHQHMKTFSIAFGVRGTISPASVPTDPTTPFAWTNPTSANQHKIDDMLHAAINGRGSFLSASNPQALRAAFESAFLEFTQASSSTSAAAFNSTSLRDGTLLYRGFYDLRDNTGELTATEVFTDGSLAAAPTWSAAEELNGKLPNNRVLVTWDDLNGTGVPFRYGSLNANQQVTLDADQVAYLRGVRTEEQPAGALRERPVADGLLGDIVNSSPVFVGVPRGFNRDQEPYPVDDLYSEFVDDNVSRRPLVYVGANDGMLHGFDALTGEELYGFVPNKIIDASQAYASTLDDFTSPFYLHQYYVDLTPRLNDVFVRASASTVTKSWNTVLVGGLGAGGKGFFALNVNDPATSYANELNAARTVLWEFTDDDDSYPVDSAGDPLTDVNGDPLVGPLGEPVKDLGYSLSLPTVAMSNVEDGGSPARKEWVAVFGNGINSTAGIAKLFVLFIDRGIGGWDPGDFVKVDTGVGVPLPPDPYAGFPNGLGSVAAIDRDLNGTLDWVYAGDRLGNLYRFDLEDPDPDNWTATRLFSATYTDGGNTYRQPILSQPLVIKHPTEPGFLVIFGTGSFSTRDDATDTEIQSIYAIWDRGESNPATAQANSKALRLVEQTITNVVDDAVSPAQTRRVITSNDVNYQPESGSPGTYGWYIDLDMPRATTTVSGAANTDSSGNAPPAPQFPGERAIRRLLFRDGTVITTTVLPSVGEATCFGARPGAILLFDAVNGGDPGRPVVDFNTDGVVDNGDLVDVGAEEFAGGLLFNQEDLDGSLVDLSTLGGQGDTDFLFVSGGNDTTSFRIEDLNDNRTGRLSWRQLEQ